MARRGIWYCLAATLCIFVAAISIPNCTAKAGYLWTYCVIVLNCVCAGAFFVFVEKAYSLL